ncbi:MAG TPA: FlgD immunoglobulin-like domain containing protein [Polyangia bacterium]
MVNFDAIRASATAPGEDKVKKTAGDPTLGKNEFLKLMMAQMSNQDPTQPTDNQAMVAQLANFATLELQQNANTHLEGLLMAQASSNQTSMAAFVGRDVVFKSDSLHLGDSGNASTSATIEKDAKNVTMVVTDASGKTVRTMQMGSQPAGTMTLDWDGRDDAGKRLPAGDYKVRVTAKDASENNLVVEQRGSGRVTGIAYEEGVAMLKLGGTKVRVSDILEINERTNP